MIRGTLTKISAYANHDMRVDEFQGACNELPRPGSRFTVFSTNPSQHSGLANRVDTVTTTEVVRLTADSQGYSFWTLSGSHYFFEFPKEKAS